jgi:hypothetical protein
MLLFLGNAPTSSVWRGLRWGFRDLRGERYVHVVRVRRPELESPSAYPAPR